VSRWLRRRAARRDGGRAGDQGAAALPALQLNGTVLTEPPLADPAPVTSPFGAPDGRSAGPSAGPSTNPWTYEWGHASADLPFQAGGRSALAPLDEGSLPAPEVEPVPAPQPTALPADDAPADASEQVARIRRDYDEALTAAGVVLFQQVAVGVDGYHVSASMATVLGWDPAAFRREGMLRSIVHPADLESFARVLPAVPPPTVDPWVETETVIDLTDPDPTNGVTPDGMQISAPAPVVRVRDATGSWKRLQIRLANGGDGRVAPVAGSFLDVTADQRDHETARRFAELVEHDPSGCLVLEFIDRSDPDTLVIRSANRAAHQMFDLDRRVVDGTPIGAVLGDASAQLVRHALFDVFHTGQSMTAERLSLGEVRGTYLDLRVDRLSDGTLGMTVTDVTGTVALEERLRHQASHDALTGLPNRALLEERLANAVAAATPEAPVALVLVDVDQLRELNEHLGLQLGDQLLVELGRRLVREVRGAAVVSRLGGDEFAVLSMPCSSDGEAAERAAAVRAALSRPFDVAGHLVECGTSIGVALAPSHAEDGRSLLRLAQSALDTAKHDGSGFHMYEATGAPSSISRLAVLTELRQGLANRDLELHYQPIVDLRTGRVDRVEAMLRWQDDRGGSRLPLEFVELAEQSGLIRPLTRWIVGEAATAAGSIGPGDRPLIVTTNLSLRNLCDPDLEVFLTQLIASGELSTELVEFEIAETELMDDPARAQETLARLSEMGVRFLVDEFGTGYTSMSTMQHLAVTGLKIDRSFISVLATDPADAAIVRSTIELSHELGLTVAADGVPDAATLSLLASFGCDHAQGVHLSPPVAADRLPERIAELEAAVRGWIGSAELHAD
jgi:diguanylate cyclase (GGDEF)-like protein